MQHESSPVRTIKPWHEQTIREKLFPLSLVFLVQCAIFGFQYVFGAGLGPAASLALCTGCTLAGSSAVYYLYLKPVAGPKILLNLMACILLQATLAVIYTWTVQPNYFDHPHTYHLIPDYEWAHSSMTYVSDWWKLRGMTTPLPLLFWSNNKNAQLFLYLSMQYFTTDSYWLNFAAFNLSHSIYLGTLTLALARVQNLTPRQCRLAFSLGAFIPIFSFPTLLLRDVAGMALVVGAAYFLCCLQHKPALLIPAIPIAAAVAFMERAGYVLIFIAAGIGYTFITRPPAQTKLAVVMSRLFSALCAAGVVVIAFKSRQLLGQINSYAGHYEQSSGSPPVRVMKLIVGPVPWTNIFTIDSTALTLQYFTMLLSSVLDNTIMLVVLYEVATRGYKRLRDSYIPLMVGVGMVGAAMFAGAQMVYAAIAVPLFVPAVITAPSPLFRRSCIIVLYAYMILNFMMLKLGIAGGHEFHV